MAYGFVVVGDDMDVGGLAAVHKGAAVLVAI